MFFFLTAEPAAMTSAAVLVCRLQCFRRLFEIVHGHMKLKRHCECDQITRLQGHAR